jgi:excisionase family DNA binding protein
MTALTTFPPRHAARARAGTRQPPRRGRRSFPTNQARQAISDPAGRPTPPQAAPFAPLIDAKAASRLLGVPYTWLLAQAREDGIPHHRLGHYVRFNPEDLREWLRATRSMPRDARRPVDGRRL